MGWNRRAAPALYFRGFFVMRSEANHLLFRGSSFARGSPNRAKKRCPIIPGAYVNRIEACPSAYLH